MGPGLREQRKQWYAAGGVVPPIQRMGGTGFSPVKGSPAHLAEAAYIFSGASTPMRRRPLRRTTRVQSASFSRAAAKEGSSPLMRQAL